MVGNKGLREGQGRPPQKVKFRFDPLRLRRALRDRRMASSELTRYLREQKPPVLAAINSYLAGTVPSIETATAIAEALNCDVRDFMTAVDGGQGDE